MTTFLHARGIVAGAPAQKSAKPVSARDKLAAIPGVEDVVIADDGRVWLVCSPDAERVALEEATAQLMPNATRVELVVRASVFHRERVRFEQLDRREERDNRVRITVTLEWHGLKYVGEALGEKGEAIEMRTAATAALVALDKVLDGTLGMRLIGVKQVRAFDAELMVVSLYKESTRQKLVGIVIMTGDACRAGALAVLSALNRSLGNTLARGSEAGGSTPD